MTTESPDMKFARHRLEDLLSTIKEQAESPNSSDKDEKDDDLDDDDDVKGTWSYRITPGKRSTVSTPGKNRVGEPPKKRSRSGKKILFELRQKPFELPNTTEDYSLYKLCRIWLHGKDYSYHYSEQFTPLSSPQKHANHLETGAEKDSKIQESSSKEIYKMPPPLNIWEKLRRVPSPIPMEHPLETLDLTDKAAILSSYMPHWKTVKQRWCKHSRELEKKCYEKNIEILQNMVKMAAQSNQYST